MDNEDYIKTIKDAIDSLGPDDEQKADMWNRIASEHTMNSNNERAGRDEYRKPENTYEYRRASLKKRIAAIAAALILVMGGMAWYSGHPGNEIGSKNSADLPSLVGYVYAAESRVTDMTAEEVLVAAGDPLAANEIYVYAPAIYYLDDEMLIFGNGTGLVIYNLAAGHVSGLIDMQAICSGYYNTDTVHTHVYVRGNELIIYNTSGTSESSAAEPFGYYHTFDLNYLPGYAALVEAAGSGNDEDTIRGFMEEGSDYEAEHYIDAWDNVEFLQSDEMDSAIGYYGGSYSENAYVRRTMDLRGEADPQHSSDETRSVLISTGNVPESDADSDEGTVEYYLYTAKVASDGSDSEDDGKKTELFLGIDDSMRASVSEMNKLPEYTYTGDDAAVGIICESLAKDEQGWYGDGGVIIPAPVVYGQEKDGDELLVYGNFWVDRYIKQGNTLISVSGGAMPACYHLKQTGKEYMIVSVDMAEDGEGYADSIKEFTKGHSEYYDKFMSSEGQDENIRKEMIKAYCDANDLGIKYYKDYGWDPVELS